MIFKYFKLILVLIFFSLIFFIKIVKADNADENISKFSEAVQAVKDKEYTVAADLFEPLALDGDIDAQYNLSILIRNGLGRPQNFSESLKWAWLSYSGGYEKAKTVLVEKLLTFVPSEDLEEIRNEVLNFILKSINSGNRLSLKQMGKFYLDVLENPNFEKAYLFYSIAVAFGETEIKDLRDELLENIDNTKIVEIQNSTNEIFEILREGDKIKSKQLDW